MKPHLLAWARSFIPHAVTVRPAERLRTCIGALVGLAVTASIIRLLPLPPASAALLVAPMGASAVLLFAVPSSPLAQPWPVFGGNVLAALIGVTGFRLFPDSTAASAISVALAIALMFKLRCIHPPAGAVALTAVVGGPAIHAMGYGFVIWPVAIQSALLVGTALAYHALTRHRYPHVPGVPGTQATPQGASQAPSSSMEKTARPTYTPDDLTGEIETWLASRDELIDVDIEDLRDLIGIVQTHTEARHAAAARRNASPAAPDALECRDHADTLMEDR